MGKKKRANRRKQNQSQQPALPQSGTNAGSILYGLLALFWLYAGITTLLAATSETDLAAEVPWLVPAAVGFFAIGWFLYHAVNLVALSGQARLAQILLIVFFLIFVAGMIPVFLSESDAVRAGAQVYLSFGLTGLLLRMSTQQRMGPGLFGSIFMSRRNR
jgi:hypothetical protein